MFVLRKLGGPFKEMEAKNNKRVRKKLAPNISMYLTGSATHISGNKERIRINVSEYRRVGV